ncbi:MAG: FtsX-like permease family protein [Clostridiales bacterium]|nr:FtsX-like permease family protein [Clostridiales bacterium]
MYHIFFIARNNAKKQKGDIITLIILSLVSALMLYIGASVMLGMSSLMDTSAKEHNTAHLYYWVPDELEDGLYDLLSEDVSVKQHEKSRADLVNAQYRNAGNKDDDWSSFQFLFGSYEESREINSLGVVTGDLTDKDILLPYYVKPQFPVGDEIEFKFGDDVVSYRVAGYVEDPMFASPINISIYDAFLSQSEVDRLADKYENLILKGYSLKFRGTDDVDVYGFRDTIWEKYQAWLAEDQSRDSSFVMEVNWWDMKGGGSFMTQIVMSIFMVFALIIMIIAMIIISFSIRNFIERNMKNTGILEAAGYKTGELSLAIVIENVTAALVGSVIGVALAAATRTALGSVVAIISGLPWNQPYNYGVAALTVAGIILLVVIVCLISARHYSRTSVLDCLRGGINNHNFKHNHFPFEKSAMPVPVTLSLKELFGDKRRNIVLTLIVAIIAISTNVGFALTETFGGQTDAIMKLAGLEMPNLQVLDSRDLMDDLKNIDMIEEIQICYSLEPTLNKGDISTSVSCDIYGDTSLVKNEMLLEGRLPVSDREICLTKKVANELGADIGDIIYIDYGDLHVDYVVTGLDQKINHMGRKAMLTDAGALRFLGTQDMVTYYIYTKEGYDFDTAAKEVGKYTTSPVDNTAKIVSETISTVTNSMYLICYVILAVTALVVVFVEILLVRSKIIREYRNYGISKALGFTSWQLMVQTMISNIPAIIIGVLLGSAVSAPVSSEIMSLSLILFGMEKITASVPVYGIVITFAGILIVALITSLICSITIRKVEPVGLLTEE